MKTLMIIKVEQYQLIKKGIYNSLKHYINMSIPLLLIIHVQC